MKPSNQRFILLSALIGTTTGFGLCFDTAAAQSNRAIFTQEQADLGRSGYLVDCASCHNADLSGGSAPALIGQTFKTNWGKHTVADLYTYMKGMMPMCDGGSLSDSEYRDILAFILSKNGAVTGLQELTPTATTTIDNIIVHVHDAH
jgi:mono/diheme cytochrome c family protein